MTYFTRDRGRGAHTPKNPASGAAFFVAVPGVKIRNVWASPPGEKGWQGTDHWHWVPGGEKQDQHYKPGDTVKAAVQVGAWGTAAVITIRVIIAIGEGAALAF